MIHKTHVCAAEDFLNQTVEVRLEGFLDPLQPKVFSLYIPFFYLAFQVFSVFKKHRNVFFSNLITEIHFKLQKICLKLKNGVKMALALHEFHSRGAPIRQMPINGKIGDVR